MPHDEGGCEASTSALSRDCDARQMSAQRWRSAKSGTDREEANGSVPSVKSTIDYLDRWLINYLDHSQKRQRLAMMPATWGSHPRLHDAAAYAAGKRRQLRGSRGQLAQQKDHGSSGGMSSVNPNISPRLPRFGGFAGGRSPVET